MSKPRLLALGDSAWTLEFGNVISPQVHALVMSLADALAHARHQDIWAGITDVVPSFRSLTVHFCPLRTDADALAQHLLEMAGNTQAQPLSGRHWCLPACFDASLAPDLSLVARSKGMREAQVIEQLLGALLRVYLIGFLPGFPYMGGLPPDLSMPRLASPRTKVPAHSIAITGQMCAVYPWDSPGGWNLVGKTPVPLFDARRTQQPALLAAGDTVRWVEVSKTEFDALFDQGQRGLLNPAMFLQTDSFA